jgi:hypothetical protein
VDEAAEPLEERLADIDPDGGAPGFINERGVMENVSLDADFGTPDELTFGSESIPVVCVVVGGVDAAARDEPGGEFLAGRFDPQLAPVDGERAAGEVAVLAQGQIDGGVKSQRIGIGGVGEDRIGGQDERDGQEQEREAVESELLGGRHFLMAGLGPQIKPQIANFRLLDAFLHGGAVG